MKALLILLLLTVRSIRAGEVKIERVPENGLQPQVVTRADGTVHLVYLTGQPNGADIRYTRRTGDATDWEKSVTVNTIPHSAVATGTIRGAQIAAGKAGQVHIVWNGVAQNSDHARAPLYYTRMLANGKFEAQRTMNEGTIHLDGGASVAANGDGGVFIVWHAAPPNGNSEADRRIFLCRSTDGGANFSSPSPAKNVAPGVCACCSLKAHAGERGTLFTIYRNASAAAQRDMILLSSVDGGIAFTPQILHPWPVAACPMSSAAIIGPPTALRAAWETNAAIFTAVPGEKARPVALSEGQARHPALALNARGETLVSWSLGTAWQRGGELGWVLLDAAGTPTGKRGTAPGVPVWSHTAAFANRAGDFVILY